MKVYGKRICGSGVRFVFETEDECLSKFDRICIDELDRLVAAPVVDGVGGPSLVDAIGIIGRICGDVKVSIEEVKEAPYLMD